jgi:hypothetical protein
MIISFFIIGAGLVVRLFALIFSIFSLPILDRVTGSITYFAGYLNYIGIMFPPLYDILNAVGLVFSVWILMYSLKIALYLWGMLPFIGKHAKLPTHK